MPTPPLRLFFTLPLPDPIASSVASWRDTLDCGGQPVAVANLHLTLAFLGSQPSERLDELLALADGIQADAFPSTWTDWTSGTRGCCTWRPASRPPPC